MPTLADKLGAPARSSSLLQRAKQLGLYSAELLEGVAVSRGCWHYRNPDSPSVPEIPESEFSNEELAVSLLSPGLPYSPHTIRVGAAMLGAEGNEIEALVRLAVAEGAVAPVQYIATAALRFEPDNLFWQRLLDSLPKSMIVPEGVMPHPTRFVSMTGITRAGAQPVTIWIRPRRDLAVPHG